MATQPHDYAEAELIYNRFMEPALRRALASLPIPRSHGVLLDAGCGPGGLFPFLTEALGKSGNVVGIDASEPHLLAARCLLDEYSLQHRVRLEQADLDSALPFPEAYFDGIWSADVITPDDFEDIPAILRRLRSVLKPGGFLALFYGNWLRQSFLPGYSRLEHLISVAKEWCYSRRGAWDGSNHPERAALWLKEAGFPDATIQFLPVCYQQPLPETVHQYLARYALGRFYEQAVREFGRNAGMADADVALWRRLSDPKSPEFILAQPDYVCLQVGILALGRKPS